MLLLRPLRSQLRLVTSWAARRKNGEERQPNLKWQREGCRLGAEKFLRWQLHRCGIPVRQQGRAAKKLPPCRDILQAIRREGESCPPRDRRATSPNFVGLLVDDCHSVADCRDYRIRDIRRPAGKRTSRGEGSVRLDRLA